MNHIVILTGAGISAESGMGTFRGAGGLWEDRRVEEVATPEGFARDPAKVHGFYNARRVQAAEATPNAAHHALARLQREAPARLGAEVCLVTQNVDGLLEAAGATALHMHGALAGALCAACGHRWPAPPEMTPQTPCPSCTAPAARPDIVWFGEIPYHMEEIAQQIAQTDLFVAIGTSGQVYPAAGLVQEARAAGADTLEINLERTEISPAFDRHLIGEASTTVPCWVDELLGAGAA